MFREAFWGCIVLIGLAGFSQAGAQPTLPGLDVHGVKDGVCVSWTCQYGNLAMIAVGRSTDSTGIFPAIGTLSKPKKGVLKYTDTDPLPGRSYYRLQIVFASGLKWNSDCVAAVQPNAKPRVPTAQVQPIVPDLVSVHQPGAGNAVGVPSKAILESMFVPPAPIPTNPKPHQPKLPTFEGVKVDTGVPKPTVKFIDPIRDSVGIADVFIESKFFTIDPITKGVNISLPLDVKTAHYALRIYDAGNKLVLQIPHLDEPYIIMDRRNFRKNGVYLFVLKKDGLELERANLSIE